MARLPAIVDALTRADGRRDRATIDNIARALREAGYLPVSGSGHRAAHLDVRNVTDLLLAAAIGVILPRGEAALTSQELRKLKRLATSSRGNQGVFKAIGDAATFGEAVDTLIDHAPDILDAFCDWCDEAHAGVPESNRYSTLFLPSLQVHIRSNLTASIQFLYNRGSGPQIEFDCSYSPDLFRPPLQVYGLKASDFAITIAIGLPTFATLYDALYQQPTSRADER